MRHLHDPIKMMVCSTWLYKENTTNIKNFASSSESIARSFGKK
jgi:hypothetical protein